MRIAVTGDAPADVASIRGAVRAALRPHGLPRDAHVTVAFVDDGEMRRLNRTYRGIDRTTDVLSFGQELPAASKGVAATRSLRREPDGTCELGDIVISTEQARRQARRARRPLRWELAFLSAHGALHLIGFEDETPSGYREMLLAGTAAALRATKGARKP